jgi:hypothetical protein
MFEFRFGNLKFFWIKVTGFCENWGMAACLNVMLHPVGWDGHHITRAQNGREFHKQKRFTSAGTESVMGCSGVGSVASKTEKGASEICTKLGKKGLAAGGAVASQANRIWPVSGATLILNFLKKSMPRMGPANVACEKLAVKSLP